MPVTTHASQSISEQLYQLVYISRITPAGLAKSNTLNDIAKEAMKNNAQYDITGLLCYGNGYFVQYIEGSEKNLTGLKNILVQDHRHRDMQIIVSEYIEQRRFSKWSMRSIVLERWLLKDAEAKRLMPFKPYRWSTEDCLDFIELLHDYYEKQVALENDNGAVVEYNALGVTLTRMVGDHQAFFVVQALLAVLVALAVVFFIL